MNQGPLRQDELLRQAQAEGGEAGFIHLVEAAIHASDAEDLSQQPLGEVLGGLRRSFEALTAYQGETSRIIITPPVESGGPMMVDIVSPDMPFIVDSALASVRAAGGSIRYFAHPVVRVSNGKVGESGGRALSALHVHADAVADLEALGRDLAETMNQVALAVRDWNAMLERLRRARVALEAVLPASQQEPLQFLQWLTEHNFTFLGLREYRMDGDAVAPVADSGLGILRDPDLKVLRSGADYVESSPHHRDFLLSDEPLLVTKSNARARVHRRVHMDYVGIKVFGEDGRVTGELRVVGMFTAQALATPHSEVPIIRRKIGSVMRRSGVDPLGHDGRTLLSALDSYPRDELFQIDVDQLFEFARVIAALEERPRVRVLPRIDRFDNFVSVLVYVPRDRYDGEARARITRYLAQVYDGRVSAYYPHFPEGELVRLHVIIGRIAGATPQPSRTELEQRVQALTSNFGDQLAEAAGGLPISDYRDAFTVAYQFRNTAEDALADIAVLRDLGDGMAVRMRALSTGDGEVGLKFYHAAHAIPLSDRVPMLEAFGFRVIDERTYSVVPRDGVERFLHDMVLQPTSAFNVETRGPAVEAGLMAVWRGEAESDQLNTLVTTAGLEWRDAALLRALSRYLRQVGISYSQRYLASVLVKQADAAAALVSLFKALHDPAVSEREMHAESERDRISAALEATSSLDEDTIIRRFLNLTESSVRTNAFQQDAEGSARPALAIKFNSGLVDGMVEPRPFREISVYSPRVEGVHLRFGAIARGGLRWSDRPEDFRTEVLGLVKAQQVKNAVIVPVGAKGGFVPKRLTAGMDRAAWAAEGLESYKIFIGALLDVTDNLVDGAVKPPENVVRRDGDDPYLVVAADKGTASFSDTANAIAIERGYWLGDAFASGGSAGYDHKEMGITARGAWEAVKRHFREMDRDIQNEPFTVAGVGDMSGDVFGNGMLLSREIRLVAAFDHRDIFIDPNPDASASFAERERLFALPRSSWQDYDKSLISAGGGIYSRGQKSIALSAEAQALLGLDTDQATPGQVISAILKADVDLLWFGGIGTYVRASSETDLEVGDRANDAIRVEGRDLRARVVGEGANLGVTQRGRIEFALGGGRINTDAIDNSAGVNSSDLEVNIKIAMQPLVTAGRLDEQQRNSFLASMTDEVAALCLENNYLQTLAISLARRAGVGELPDHQELIEGLEARGLLDRAVEFLPNNAVIAQRSNGGIGLTRPEIAVILAYAKLTLYSDLLGSTAIDDQYLAGELFRYFPDSLHQRYPEAVENHRLRREVIATVLANAMINRGGPSFVSELTQATTAGSGEAALAYAATRDVFGLTALDEMIDRLDGTVSGDVQLSLYAAVQALLRQEALWFLRNGDVTEGLSALVARHKAGVEALRARLDHLPQSIRVTVEGARQAWMDAGVPAEVAQQVAILPVLGYASHIVLVSERSGVVIEAAADAFFGVMGAFELWNVIEQGRNLILVDRFERMALDRALANLMRAQRDLTADVLRATDGNAGDGLTAWMAAQQANVVRTQRSVAELMEGNVTVARLSVAAGLLADLAREN